MNNKQILNKNQTQIKVNELGQYFLDGIVTETEFNNLLDKLADEYILYMPAINEARRTVRRISRQFSASVKYQIPYQELRG